MKAEWHGVERDELGAVCVTACLCLIDRSQANLVRCSNERVIQGSGYLPRYLPR